MGAIVSLFFADIGEYAVVAEGAVVKKHQTIPPRVVVGGAPAKVLRELEEKRHLCMGAQQADIRDLAARCKAPAVSSELTEYKRKNPAEFPLPDF